MRRVHFGIPMSMLCLTVTLPSRYPDLAKESRQWKLAEQLSAEKLTGYPTVTYSNRSPR